MKKRISIVAAFCLVTVAVSFAQSQPRSHAAGRFALDIAGGQGFIKPIEQGDTLTYTISKLSDSVLVKKKFKTIPVPPGKKYYLKFKVKKKTD